MLFKAIVLTLFLRTLSYSVTDFSNKFCDNSSINQMIDRVFQTPTTIYIIRNSMVYPLIQKEMPLIVGKTHFWTQKRDAFHMKSLFLGINLFHFETGFTITLNKSNKNFVRDYRHKPSYYYLTFIFSGHHYYLFKELSNNSFVLANNEEIPLNLENQGSIEKVFGIRAPIYASNYKIMKTDSITESSFLYLLSNDNIFYGFVLHKTNEHITELKPKNGGIIDQNYRKYRAQNIRGTICTNIPYIILDNSLIKLVDMENLSESERFSIWEAFGCDYFTNYLPQLEQIQRLKELQNITTTKTTIPEPTVIIKPKKTSYWLPIIVLTLIFLFFGFVIYLPSYFSKRNEKKSPTYSSKDTKDL